MKPCAWGDSSPEEMEYHDKERGVPVHDERLLFEFLTLEGVQAGLSWLTVLKKRENYRRAFTGFEPADIARYSQKDLRRLLGDAGIIRNRLKITNTITNAERLSEVQKEFGSFERYIWQFVGGKPVTSAFKSGSEVPNWTKELDVMSKDLKKRGSEFIRSNHLLFFLAGC